jgi:hypothetical protein
MISGASTKSKKLRKSISRTKILCLGQNGKFWASQVRLSSLVASNLMQRSRMVRPLHIGSSNNRVLGYVNIE